MAINFWFEDEELKYNVKQSGSWHNKVYKIVFKINYINYSYYNNWNPKLFHNLMIVIILVLIY